MPGSRSTGSPAKSDAGTWSQVPLACGRGNTSTTNPTARSRSISAASEVATAYGLLEDGAWADYALAEAQMSAGRWEESIASGLRAIDLGEQHGYHRVVVRSWFVLMPIARAQARTDLIEQAFPRFEQRARMKHEADSFYARIVATATHLHFAALGLEPPFVPDVAERLPCFDMDQGGASWVAAVETVVDVWLAAGELDAVEEALTRMRASLRVLEHRPGARTEAILRARLAFARGDLGPPPRRRRRSRTPTDVLPGGERRRSACSSTRTRPIGRSSPRQTRSRACWASPAADCPR